MNINEKLLLIGKKYNDAHNKYFEMMDIFDRERVYAECEICRFEKEYMSHNFGKRYYTCENKPACKKVIKAYKKALDADLRLEQMTEEYAEAIFDAYKENRPVLIDRKTSKDVEWSEAFGDDFSSFTDAQKTSLIALIENDGGRYRLK